MQGIGNSIMEVEYSLVNAVLESTRVASESRTKSKLTAFRHPSGEIQPSGADTESGWKRSDLVPTAPPGGPIA